MMRGYGLRPSGSGRETIARSCEDGSEPTGSIKDKEFLN